MKRIPFFIAAIALSAPLASVSNAAPATGNKPAKTDAHGRAHGRRGDGKRGDRGAMRMAQELNLTAAQRTKIKAIMTASRDKRKALRDKKLTETERRTQMRAIGEQTRAQIAAILTPAQKKKMAEMRKQRHEKMKARGEKPRHL